MRLQFIACLGLFLLSLGASAAVELERGLAAYARSDFATARRLLTAAAEAGDSEAQFVLGKMHANGDGVLQDFVQAHKWFNLAAAAGSRDAKDARNEVSERMTPGQLAEAQNLARRFRPRESAATLPDKPASGAAAHAPGGPPETRRSTAGRATTRTPSPTLPAGNQAQRIQTMLAELGYDPGPADGIPGSKTRAAIRQYQGHSGMHVDGQIGDAVHDALANDLGYEGPIRTRDTGTGAASTTDSGSNVPTPSRSTPLAGRSTDRHPEPETPRTVTRAGAPPAAQPQAVTRAASELRALVREARRTGAADAILIGRLHELSTRYDRPVALSRILYDAFTDRELRRNPRWQVRAGRFWVDQYARLRSEVAVPTPPQELSKEDLPLAVLGALLGQGIGQGIEKTDGTPPAAATPAVIEVPARITSAFALRSSFSVAEGPGQLRFSLLGRDPGQAYHLLYAAGSNPRIELTAEDGRRSTVLARIALDERSEASRGIEWTRDSQGRMRVSVDRVTVVDTGPALTSLTEFGTFQISNLGGSFGIESVEILGSGR